MGPEADVTCSILQRRSAFGYICCSCMCIASCIASTWLSSKHLQRGTRPSCQSSEHAGIDLLAAGTLYCPRYVPPSLSAEAGTRFLFCLLPYRATRIAFPNIVPTNSQNVKLSLCKTLRHRPLAPNANLRGKKAEVSKIGNWLRPRGGVDNGVQSKSWPMLGVEQRFFGHPAYNIRHTGPYV